MSTNANILTIWNRNWQHEGHLAATERMPQFQFKMRCSIHPNPSSQNYLMNFVLNYRSTLKFSRICTLLSQVPSLPGDPFSLARDARNGHRN